LISYTFSLSLTPLPPTSTLFPYTTLFRSWPQESGRSRIAPEDARTASAPAGRGALRPMCRRRRGDGWSSSASGRCREFRRADARSEEHTSELQSRVDLVCRLLLEKKNTYR